jgi:hypothetical protein
LEFAAGLEAAFAGSLGVNADLGPVLAAFFDVDAVEPVETPLLVFSIPDLGPVAFTPDPASAALPEIPAIPDCAGLGSVSRGNADFAGPDTGPLATLLPVPPGCAALPTFEPFVAPPLAGIAGWPLLLVLP